jgi:hypothetical protein
MLAGLTQARAWWAGGSSPRAFLLAQPREVVRQVASAAAAIASTRAAALTALLVLVDAQSPGGAPPV